MICYVFDSEAKAIQAADTIIENVRAWVASNSPSALDGKRLRGRNAASGELVNVYTETWATPQRTASGAWVFEKPTATKVAPIPLGVFTAGIDASEAEYDPAWFPSQYV